MHKLIIVLILSIFSLEYLSKQIGVIPRFVILVPEMISVCIMALVLAQIGASKTALFPKKYKIFLLFYLLSILLGVVINSVSPGPLIVGIRTHLKFLPLFMLPFAYSFSEREIRIQLALILALMMVQTPLAIYQRFFEPEGALTGDVVRGTIQSSGILTILMASGLAILMSLYLARKISKKSFFIFAPVIFLPMTINETKSSLLFIPIAIFGPLIMANTKGKFKDLVPVALIGVVALVSFVTIYDVLVAPRWGYGLMDFFSMEGRAERYLYKGVDLGDNSQTIGRIDSYVLAVRVLSDDPLNLLFGLGIGNVSSPFLQSLEGEYYGEYAQYGPGITALTQIIWETGLIGAILTFTFLYLVYRDTQILRRQNSFMGVIASGWAVVVVILVIVVPYMNFMNHNVVGYFFWYFSGVVAANRYQWLLRARRQRFRRVADSEPSVSFAGIGRASGVSNGGLKIERDT